MTAPKPVDRRPPRVAYPDTLTVEGNNGGSFVTLDKGGMPPGMVRLKVGETCVYTVDQEISVVALAAILTWCKDRGFQKIVDEYYAQNGGPVADGVHVERDIV